MLPGLCDVSTSSIPAAEPVGMLQHPRCGVLWQIVSFGRRQLIYESSSGCIAFLMKHGEILFSSLPLFYKLSLL